MGFLEMRARIDLARHEAQREGFENTAKAFERLAQQLEALCPLDMVENLEAKEQPVSSG